MEPLSDKDAQYQLNYGTAFSLNILLFNLLTGPGAEFWTLKAGTRNMLCIALLLLLAGLCSGRHPLQVGKSLTLEEQKAEEFVARAEKELIENTRKATVIEWAYYTNITDHNEKAKLDYQKVSDALGLKLGKEAKQFDQTGIRDRDVRRKLVMISQIGTSILPDNKRERLVDRQLL